MPFNQLYVWACLWTYVQHMRYDYFDYMRSIIYILFVQITLLVPGYVVIKKTKWLKKNPGIELSFAYLLSVVFFASLAVIHYIGNINFRYLQIFCWLALILSGVIFIKEKYYLSVWKLRFPLICSMLMCILSVAFLGLTYSAPRNYVPDPVSLPNRNYNVLSVKVLNISHTQANDNYIPYRQAQFIVNRSDPAHDSFIDEWGVHFFQRTPLMGAVTATYFGMLSDKPPVDYTWSANTTDPSHTYIKFQLISTVLNSLFIIPAFFLLTRFFNKKTAAIAGLFITTNQFFLYNSVFSWPKSFVAFFILLSWLLLLEKNTRYTILAGVASGVAYLTHDLAVLYIGTSVVLLLANKRIRDIFIYGFIASAFALPWLIIAQFLYHKPSSFIYYPLSTHDIPQPSMKRQIIHEFLHTSPLRLIFTRIHNFIYMTVPYQLLTSEGGQSAGRRIWALGEYSISGAVGLGLFIPMVIGAFKKIVKLDYWILVVTPVIFAALIIGWPKGLAALHFAEAVVVLLSGLGVAYLMKLKQKNYVLVAYVINLLQFGFLLLYSFDVRIKPWLTGISDLARLCVLGAALIFAGLLVREIATSKKSKLSLFSGI